MRLYFDLLILSRHLPCLWIYLKKAQLCLFLQKFERKFEKKKIGRKNRGII